MTMVVEREETKDEEEGEDEDKVEALTKHEEDHNQEEVLKCSSFTRNARSNKNLMADLTKFRQTE